MSPRQRLRAAPSAPAAPRPIDAPDDDELVRAAQQGDRLAFEALFRRRQQQGGTAGDLHEKTGCRQGIERFLLNVGGHDQQLVGRYIGIGERTPLSVFQIGNERDIGHGQSHPGTITKPSVKLPLITRCDI